MSEIQKEATRKMAVQGVRLAGKNETKYGDAIGLARTRGGEIVGDPEFAFAGIDGKGTKHVIPLANVRSFRLVEVRKKLVGSDDVVVEVTEFPTLSPAQLLAMNPTYSALAAGYVRTLTLTIADLSLTGRCSGATTRRLSSRRSATWSRTSTSC